MKQDTGMKNEFGEIPMGYFSEQTMSNMKLGQSMYTKGRFSSTARRGKSLHRHTFTDGMDHRDSLINFLISLMSCVRHKRGSIVYLPTMLRLSESHDACINGRA